MKKEVVIANEKLLLDLISKEIWAILSKHTKDKDSLMASSATLLKIAIQLYTVIFEKDEDVSKMLETANESITHLREQMEDDIWGKTIH